MVLVPALTAIGILILAILAFLLIPKHRLKNAKSDLVKELFEDADLETDDVFTKDDLEGLPEPVRKYLDSVLTEGQPYVRTIRLRQRGEFLLGDDDSGWKNFEATQYFTVDPPGFIWDAEIKFGPMIPVSVVDMYKEGEGFLRAKLLSSLTVADAEPSPEMNSGELLRYLGERVWFPTSLLPEEGVEWEEIDESSARATIEHRGNTASLVFHFNERNEVERVFTEERYNQEEETFHPWTGYFRNYQEKNGIRVPVEAEAEYNLPEGDQPYWRGQVEEIEYGISER